MHSSRRGTHARLDEIVVTCDVALGVGETAKLRSFVF